MQPVVLITGYWRKPRSRRGEPQAGFHVVGNYRCDDVAARSVVEAIHDAVGKAIAIAGDIARESHVVRIFETVDHELGRLTALVNNAGILETQARVESIDAARLNRSLTTNATGAFLCAREAIRRMSTRHGGQGGAIVNVSSAAARLGAAGE